MSRQNKVNPGKYTQAGRLSQDDAAREAKKQREAEPIERAKPPVGGPQRTKPRVLPEDKETENTEVNH
jgi:hypothetical protein